jgi:hypothetical protein
MPGIKGVRSTTTIAAAVLLALLLVGGNEAMAEQEATDTSKERPTVSRVVPYLGTLRIVKPGRGGNPQPLVTTCSAGTGESCALFAANCLAANGYYDGDSSGGTCCSGVDHPNSNPQSPCS